MMRLIDNDKTDAPRTRKAVAVNGQELGRREHDAGAARSQAGKHVIARRLHGFAGQHAYTNAERSHRRREVIGLVGNERTQRIDKDARTPAQDCLARGMHMEDKRLAAPRSHNGQNALVIGQGIERLDLRTVRLVRADKAVNERACELGIGKLGERLALAGLQTKTGVRRLHAAAKLTCRVVNAGRRGIADQDILDHELGLYATLPMLSHSLEHQVDGAIAIDELIDLRHAEHNGRHTRGAIGRHEAHVLAGFAHHGAIAHCHALGRQQRHLVALAKRLKTGDLLDGLNIQLGEVDGGSNLVGVLKVLGGKLGQHGGKATTELVELRRLDGHAYRTRMPAATNQQIGAAFYGVEQVDFAHRATRTASDTVFDREQQRRHVIAVGQAARHDTLDALVPALAAHDDRASTIIGLLDLCHGIAREFRLDLAALAVDFLELSRQRACLDRIAGKQQVKCQFWIGHAAGGVQTGNERKRQAIGRNAREVGLGERGQRDIAGTGRHAHLLDALGNQCAILGRERHHVGHGAQRSNLDQRTPIRRLAQTLTQNLHQLECHTGTGKFTRGALILELWVGQRHALRHLIGGLVMVRNHQIDPQALQIGNLFLGGNTVIDGHDQVGLGELVNAVERRTRQAVALVKAMRNKRCDIGAKRAQRLGQQAGRRNAVNVKIAKDGNALVAANSTLDAVGNDRHARDNEWVGPVAIERRRQKQLAFLDGCNAVRNHNARHQPGYAQASRKLLFELGVLPSDRPAMRRLKR